MAKKYCSDIKQFIESFYIGFQDCKEKGGILAEVWTEDKQKELTAFVIEYEKKNPKNTHYWMGYRNFECWVWLSDTPLCYKNWFQCYTL